MRIKDWLQYLRQTLGQSKKIKAAPSLMTLPAVHPKAMIKVDVGSILVLLSLFVIGEIWYLFYGVEFRELFLVLQSSR